MKGKIVCIFFCYLGFIRHEKGKKCDYKFRNVIKEFPTSSETETGYVNSRNDCEKYCSITESCWGCSVSCESKCHWKALSGCEQQENWKGLINGDISEKPGISI